MAHPRRRGAADRSIVCHQLSHWWAPQLRNGDVVRWFYADAATAPAHEGNIAAVTVRALCDESHDGREHVLTGPPSRPSVSRCKSSATQSAGRCAFEELSRESARELMLAMMFPPPVADMLLNPYAAAVGQPALVTSTVLEVTGHRCVRSTIGLSTMRGDFARLS
jgi:hypothetical protein